MSPPLFRFGKLIAIAGIILVAVGTLLMAGSRLGLLGSIGRMPGPSRTRGKNVSFYFPIVTSLILSVLVTLVLS